MAVRLTAPLPARAPSAIVAGSEVAALKTNWLAKVALPMSRNHFICCLWNSNELKKRLQELPVPFLTEFGQQGGCLPKLRAGLLAEAYRSRTDQRLCGRSVVLKTTPTTG